MIGAIVLAAGSGSRMQARCNKQYLKINGEMVLAHTLRVFANHHKVDGVVLVVRRGDEVLAAEAVDLSGCHDRLVAQVIGGKERQESVGIGLGVIPEHWTHVLIHDGARPLVSEDLISKVIESCDDEVGVVPILPIRDTVKRLSPDGDILETIPREQLALAQTPQAFPLTLIRQAHKVAAQEGICATDDASLFEALNLRVRSIPGEVSNIKVTVPEDLALAEWYALRRKEHKEGAHRNRL